MWFGGSWGDGKQEGMGVWEGDGELGGVWFWGDWGDGERGGVELFVSGVLVVDWIGDGIGVVGVEFELGSRRVGMEGVGDTTLSILGDLSQGCPSKRKIDKCYTFWVISY